MKSVWDVSEIQRYIDDEIQESLILDYKAAASLGKTNGKKKEITKDVSAMANSAGGTIIYGIAEFQTPEKKHLPERMDPVDQTDFSREWLQQVINNIHPRLDGLTITPVSVSAAPADVVYVVEIPQSTTAHQASDHRYYKRYNFLSQPMEDHEIRDVMGRGKNAKIDLSFEIEIRSKPHTDFLGRETTTTVEYVLVITAMNVGAVYAKYVSAFFTLPDAITWQCDYLETEPSQSGEGLCREYAKYNTTQDVLGYEGGPGLTIPKYGPSRFRPILPGLAQTWEIELSDQLTSRMAEDLEITWSVHADNAPSQSGGLLLSDIPLIDCRDTAGNSVSN
jgi:hypothetical protein